MSLEVHIEKKLNGFTLRSDFTAGNTATAILGASGCGKSMTLRCIAGIVKPDKGRIVLDGRVLFDSEQHIDLPPQQRGVGLLFQNYALFPNMTVEQNILCGLKAERDKAARKARCDKQGCAGETRQQAAYFALHLLAEVAVQCAERLIQHQNLRLAHQNTGQRGALLLSAAAKA